MSRSRKWRLLSGFTEEEWGRILACVVGAIWVAYVNDDPIFIALVLAFAAGALFSEALRNRAWREGNSPEAVRRRRTLERLPREDSPDQ